MSIRLVADEDNDNAPCCPLVADEDNEEPIEKLMRRAKEADEALKAAQADAKRLNAELMDRLAEVEHRAKTIPYRTGESLRVVRIANARLKVDEDGLAKALGVRTFNTVSDRKVNMDKLELAVLEKRIEKEQVSAYVRSEDHPYLRFYVVRDDSAGD